MYFPSDSSNVCVAQTILLDDPARHLGAHCRNYAICEDICKADWNERPSYIHQRPCIRAWVFPFSASTTLTPRYRGSDRGQARGMALLSTNIGRAFTLCPFICIFPRWCPNRIRIQRQEYPPLGCEDGHCTQGVAEWPLRLGLFRCIFASRFPNRIRVQ